ncbi:energy transducer TonB [Shewanella violacea]|uniref:TonB1 protein n=1 Tax=Shewanella violacea (strain JCM 10179 / CIP 106290 / LMG 19151 / DSS12) TaxID=637905 RepID=D4ZBY5_SHEVD|nr:TonB1 protein [Shewanella violacea DSS12]
MAFGCITLLLQGGLIAALDAAPQDVHRLQMNSGSVMGQTQSLNLSIARPAKVETKPTPQKEPEPKQEIAKVQQSPVAQPIETLVAKTQTKPLAKSSVKPVKQVIAKQVSKPKTKELAKSAPKPVLTAKADVQVPNQAELAAKQGVSKTPIKLSKPTFSSPPAQPRYPKLARKRGFEGTATIEVIFNHIGEQLSLTLIDSSGFSLLDRAAIMAVEQWQFSPPSPQTAYAYTVKVPVRFALN